MHAFPVEEARRLAQQWLGLIRQGLDPMAQRQGAKTAPTVAEVAARYLAEHAEVHKKPSSVTMDRVNLRLHLLPALGTRQVAQLTSADVAALQHQMRATPGAANRVLALLSKMCSLAETWGLRPPGTNPVRGIARYRERQLERYLSPEELARLGAVLQHAAAQRTEHPSVLACVWLLLYTGARLGEVLGLQWSMLDWQAGVARLPDSKTGAKTLYLPPPALALLQALPRPEGVPWRLPSRRHGQPLSNPHKPWYRLTAQAGLPGVRLHDLRHTWVSLGLRTGVGLDLLGKAVGHQHVATTQRYAHLAEDPLWQVAAQVGIAVQTALTGGPVAAGH